MELGYGKAPAEFIHGTSNHYQREYKPLLSGNWNVTHGWEVPFSYWEKQSQQTCALAKVTVAVTEQSQYQDVNGSFLSQPPSPK